MLNSATFYNQAADAALAAKHDETQKVLQEYYDSIAKACDRASAAGLKKVRVPTFSSYCKSNEKNVDFAAGVSASQAHLASLGFRAVYVGTDYVDCFIDLYFVE